MKYFLADHENNTLENFDDEEDLTSYLLNEIEICVEDYGLLNLQDRINKRFTCIRGDIINVRPDYNFSLTLG